MMMIGVDASLDKRVWVCWEISQIRTIPIFLPSFRLPCFIGVRRIRRFLPLHLFSLSLRRVQIAFSVGRSNQEGAREKSLVTPSFLGRPRRQRESESVG